MEYPKSPDRQIRNISKILKEEISNQGVKFSLNSTELYPDEVIGGFGCLPLFLAEATEVYEKLFNAKYSSQELLSFSGGLSNRELTQEEFLEEEAHLDKPSLKKMPLIFEVSNTGDTYFGYQPMIGTNSNGSPFSFFLLSHIVHYVFESYVLNYKNNPTLLVNGTIPLEPLAHKMLEKINLGLVDIKIPTPKTSMVTNH